MKSKREKNLLQRVSSPTPKFFRVLRDLGLALAAVGGAVLTAPVSVPAVVTSVAGYVAVVGGVLTAVSQATVKGE
ncbi:MAG: hypothetical protein WBG42_08935 [Cryomorphaceae bacterium]